MHSLSENVNRKFTNILNVNNYQIETDTGWSDIDSIAETVAYDIWELKLQSGKTLKCADNHIVFTDNMNEIFVKDLHVGQIVYTDTGIDYVESVIKTCETSPMFDLALNDINHRYFTNGILSHNTTIINALTYALYNKPFDNISLQRLINSTNNSKNTLMEVRLRFEKGEDEFEIYRCRGETFNIQIVMNGEDITLDSVSENDHLIQEIIGMSYELFTKVVIFSGSSVPFLQLPVAQQRLQIEELFNITLLTEKAIKLKEIIKTTDNNISIQEAIIKEQEQQLAHHNKQINDAQNRVNTWDRDRVNQIQSLESQLALLNTINMDDEKSLHTLTTECENDLSVLKQSKNLFDNEFNTLKKDIKKLSDELAHLTDEKCPYCLQKYEGALEKLDEKKVSYQEKLLRFDSVSNDVNLLQDEIVNLNIQINDAKSLMKFKTLADAIKAESSYHLLEQKITDLKNSINPHLDALNDLKSAEQKTISYDQLDAMKLELEHQQFLLKLLTDKNSFIRRKIINRTIPFLNARLVYYTKEIGLPHIVKFDDDMSCTVSEYGRDMDFGNLSNGEKKRVNVALSLAFRDVLHHLHARVNCLFIDEIDASLDGSGVEQIFKLFKQKSREDGLGLWIISHRPESIGRFDRTVIIRKENGFSKILDEHGEEINIEL